MRGIFPLFALLFTKNNKRGKQTKKCIYSAYIYIKAFLLGEKKTVEQIQPLLLHNQINSQIYHYTLQCYIIDMLPAVNEQIQL